MKKYITLTLMLLGLFFLDGCTHVASYEKEELASKKMLSSPMPERAAIQSHVLQIREGTFGAEIGFQGGCGCK